MIATEDRAAGMVPRLPKKTRACPKGILATYRAKQRCGASSGRARGTRDDRCELVLSEKTIIGTRGTSRACYHSMQ
jgi:hypothetical protein